jgi:hypothetical protein
MGLLATSQFHFSIPIVEVSQETIFSSNQMREGGDLGKSVVNLLNLYGKIFSLYLGCAVRS